MKKTLSLAVAAAVALTALGWISAYTAAPPTSPQTPPPATWAFTPDEDAFDPTALLDLRALNEPVAGEKGFVRVNEAGEFVRGDGEPLRFWAVNTDVARRPFTPAPLGPRRAADLARHARFLAKRGVNMVRLHRQLSPDAQANPQASLSDIDSAERDNIWRTVAAMRKEGIYTALSPYWSAPMKFAPEWLPGGAPQTAFGLLFFDPTLQSAYKSWLKQLLAEKNPYTGIALAHDPSLAIVQLQNEDSLLFWTVDLIKGPQREALEHQFNTFLRLKYPDGAQLQTAWRGEFEGSPPPATRMPLLPMAELTQPDTRSGRTQRQADQTEFYTRLMFDFNQEIVRYLRQDLGVESLISAGNWKTANPAQLGDAERWSYTPGDVDAVNRYTTSLHQGPDAGWAVREGDTFTSDSVLHQPRLLPLNLRQTLVSCQGSNAACSLAIKPDGIVASRRHSPSYDSSSRLASGLDGGAIKRHLSPDTTRGRPMWVSEGSWPMPQAFATEGPFLIASYASLLGIDGYTWYHVTDEGWSPPQSANGYLPSQAKWVIASPDTLGTFPAAALAYRRGYIQTAQPVLTETRSLEDLWQRRPPWRPEEPSFDPNRDKGTGAAAGTKGSPWPAEAFLVGPVQVTFQGTAAPKPHSAPPLPQGLTPGVIHANTGQIVLNHQLGFCTVDTPQAQGVAAFFRQAPTHQLSDVRFTSGNDYGAAWAVSMDGEPLKTSRRILVQYGTQSRPTGWRETPAKLKTDNGTTVTGATVTSYGQAPWQVVKGQLEVSIHNPHLTRATALDMNGMPLETLTLEHTAQGVSFRFPHSAMYVVLEAVNP